TGAERRLAAATAERAGHVAALALLQQHDEEQQQATQDVQNRQQVVEHNDRFYQRRRSRDNPRPVRPVFSTFAALSRGWVQPRSRAPPRSRGSQLRKPLMKSRISGKSTRFE